MFKDLPEGQTYSCEKHVWDSEELNPNCHSCGLLMRDDSVQSESIKNSPFVDGQYKEGALIINPRDKKFLEDNGVDTSGMNITKDIATCSSESIECELMVQKIVEEGFNKGNIAIPSGSKWLYEVLSKAITTAEERGWSKGWYAAKKDDVSLEKDAITTAVAKREESYREEILDKLRNATCYSDPSRGVLLSNPPQHRCDACGKLWYVGDKAPVCEYIRKADITNLKH